MDFARDNFKNILHTKVSGLKEVSSPEQCQVILLFCPIVSRAGTDIDAALSNLNQVKDSMPVIMVILHPTFDSEKILSDSNNAIKRENTFAVDCLFHDTGLLKCQKNDDAIDKTAKYLKSKKLTSYYCLKKDRGNPNLSTDRNAENSPLINEGGSVPPPNSTQEDSCWSRFCRFFRSCFACFNAKE
ncbi:uncharacterized protein [Chanodichthys erythropterus]